MGKNGFIFNTPKGKRVGEARDLEELRKLVKKVPLESLEFHFERGDFVRWLMYIKEPGVAARIRAMKGVIDLRGELLYALSPPKPKKPKKSRK